VREDVLRGVALLATGAWYTPLVQVAKAPPDAPYRDPHGLPDLRPR
jgi:hypothetical protein